MIQRPDGYFEKLVDVINGTHGVHPGFRAAHAKGICCAGTFTATAEAAALSRATHMQGGVLPVTVRFSNGSGNPGASDAAKDARGMAVKVALPGGGSTDMVGITIPIFFARTADTFIEFTRARRPDPKTGQPDPAAIGAVVALHPELGRVLAILGKQQQAASYASVAYNGIHTFRLVSSRGVETAIRYVWRPESGTAFVTDEEAAKRSQDFLQDELRRRLDDGPVGFTLHFILAGPGDDQNDPTTAWPEDRPTILAGRMELTRALLASTADGDDLIFDPTSVPDGVVCSEDEILHARSAAYSVSFARRQAGAKGGSQA